MAYIKLGSSDLLVSRVCLGCMGFGDPQAGQHSWTVSEDATADADALVIERVAEVADARRPL